MTNNVHIECQREERILVLTLNRPEKKNALTGAMYRSLTSAFEQAKSDNGIRVVLITAKGDYFCAGNDVHGFKEIANIHYSERPGFNFMNTLAKFPKPVVAALPGDAVGIGVTLLLHCDLVYLTQKSQLHLPFVNIGLVPEFGSTTLMTHLLGHQRAAEIFFLRQRLNAAEALAIGLANDVLPANEVLSTAMDSCRALSQLSPAALQQTKRLMKLPQQAAVVDKIEQETLAINDLLSSITLPNDKTPR